MATSRPLTRRGMFEVQFNWIFILIAGAVILAFFFSVVQKQRTISETRLTLTLLNEIDAVTTGAAVAKGATQSVGIPRSGLEFTCEGCACTINVGKSSRPYRDKRIFAPRRIEGKEVVFWSLDWQLPFRVTNFLFATNDAIKYFFVYDDANPASQQLRSRIEKVLPDDINAEFITVDKICPGDDPCVRNENYVQVKFVFLDINFQGYLQMHESFEDTDVTGTHLTSNAARFYRCPRVTGECTASPPASQPPLSYAGDAAFFAAIFAYDAEMFQCNLQESARRLGYVTHVLNDRMTEFKNDQRLVIDRADPCLYNPQPIGNLWSLAAQLSGDLQPSSTGQPLVQGDFTTLSGIAGEITSLNEQLIRQSCPTLY